MGEHRGGDGTGHPDPDRARSFDRVADAYHRARPSYPREAAAWVTGGSSAKVLELGAGTGKLTEQLSALGHAVTATDPSAAMLSRVTPSPLVQTVLASAERIPVVSRSMDVVVSAQAFHWFDPARALPEIARVLRSGGLLGLLWNERDERIPWVRRLGALIGPQDQVRDPSQDLVGSCLFGFVETATFRFWQPLNRESLHDLVRSRSNIAVLSDLEQERVLRKVDALYDEYGRGADGMLLPYVTRCFRSVVKPQVLAEEETPATGPDDLDTDPLLIDFR